MARLSDIANNKNNNFYFLRIMAATFVIVSHSFSLFGFDRYEPFAFLHGYAEMGTFGLYIFFIISGFLVAKSWMNNSQLISFLKKRILRIFPGYIFATFFTAYVVGLLTTTLPKRVYLTHEWTSSYLTNILMYFEPFKYWLPGVFETNKTRIVNGSLWTLPIEFFMYLFLALLGILGLLNKKRIFLFILIISFLLEVALFNFPQYKTIVFLQMNITDLVNLGLYFLMGMGLYLYREKIVLENKIFLFFIILLLFTFSTALGNWVSYIVLPYIVIFIAYIIKFPFFQKLEKFGDFSYGMYIFAWPVQQTIIYYYKKEINLFSYLIFAYIITLILAIFSWHLLEKRMLILKSKNIRQLTVQYIKNSFIFKFLSKNKYIYRYITHLIILFVFIILSFYLNRISSNSFIARGDFYQLINPANHVGQYFYFWINQIGQGTFNLLIPTFPFYVSLGIVSYFIHNSGIQTGFYFFFLTYLSFLSFYLSIKVIYPDIKQIIRIGSALVYAFNNFTITIFTYSWGFSHQFFIYIFVPPLVLLFYKILINNKKVNIYVVIYYIVFLISIVSYNNIAFLVLISLVQLIFLLALIFDKQITINKNLFIKLLKFIPLYLSLFWLLIPTYFYMIQTVPHATIVSFGGNALKQWIIDTSSNFLNTFLFALDSTRFPISNFNIFNILSFSYFGIIVFLLVKLHNSKNKSKEIFLFLFILLIFIFLSVRAYAPVKNIGLFIYLSKLFSIFRSPEKIFSIIPFLYCMVLVGLLKNIKLNNKFVYAIFGILLLIPYPLYSGGVIKSLSGIDSYGNRSIVKIPMQYYNIQQIINTDNRLGSIISLPYAVDNSINWSNYPKWHFVGQDALYLLYNKFYISANVYDYKDYTHTLSFKTFNDKKQSLGKLLKLIQNFSGQYVFYHKDIDPKWIKKTTYVDESLKKLASQSKLTLLNSNSYFDLYKVNDTYVVPLISSESNLLFQQINPTKYKIYMRISNKKNLIFHQSFDPGWKLYLVQNPSNVWCTKLTAYKTSPTTECRSQNTFFQGEELSYFFKKPLFDATHKMVSDYANEWVLDPNTIKSSFDKSYYKVNPDGSIDVEMILYYQPQSYFYIGIIVSGGILLFCCIYFGYYFYRRRKNI